MKPLVVVLGASGFLGTAVTRQLLERPIRLRLVARRSIEVPAGSLAEVEIRSADLAEPGAVASAVEGADAVIHLVAHIDGPSTWRVEEGDTVAERVNLGLVHDLVDAFRGRQGPPPVVVFSGSMSQVGKPTGGPALETDADLPDTVYDRQKLAAEHALRDATAEGVVRGTTLRLATLYGQGSGPSALERGVVSAMMRRAFAGEPLTMWHDGTVARDLICVDDVASAFVAALDHADALAGKHWLIGTCQSVRIGDLFTMIAEVVATHTGREPVPVVSVASEHAGASDMVDFVSGSTAFAQVTGWAPQVDLRPALDGAARAMERIHHG